MSDAFVIKFPDASADIGNQLASDLRQELRSADPRVQVDTQRSTPSAQDFGATLVLILGTSAVTAIAKGIVNWVTRNSGVRLVIETSDGKVLADHLHSENARQIVSDVFSRKTA